MRHLDAQLMLTQARKAGVRITDLYSALAYCHPDHPRFSVSGEEQVDANGYHHSYNERGHNIYQQTEPTAH